MNVCKVCGKEFGDVGLHTHIIKSHDLSTHAYYEKYYPRCDKLTGEKILFKDYKTYFESEFSSNENMISWLRSANVDEAKRFCLDALKKRIAEKELKYAPSFVELSTIEGFPPYKAYVHFFGSYHAACKEIGYEPLLSDIKTIPKIEIGSPTIIIDTREQQPLKFKKSFIQKLSIGDYTFAHEDYSYTYVDRKSESDFKSTVTGGFERFVKEIERAEKLSSYVYVVVESSIKDIEENNKISAHKAKMKYVWSNMRKIQHLFPRKVQFVFTGSRESSEKIIPYLLRYGDILWNVDVQYLLNKKGI